MAEENKYPKQRMIKEQGKKTHKSHMQNYLLSSLSCQLDLKDML